MTTLKQLGEREVIRRLSALLAGRPDVSVGIGDDVAVVRIEESNFDFLLTSDALIEGIHFLEDTDSRGIGHKAIGRVLSDLAATGGEPLWALVNLVASPSTPFERVEKIYRGISALAGKYGMTIVGGDTSAGPNLQLHLFGVGQTPKDSAVLRSGAKAGDFIYVTGTLGGSIAGKHLDFEPRVEEGLWLREHAWASSMIDLTDGLATDLRHILDRSNAGAELDRDKIPLSEFARHANDGRVPLDHALFDGEDFELLFTVRADNKDAFECLWKDSFNLPCTLIGRITATVQELKLIDPDGKSQVLTQHGYEHFSE